MKGFPCTNTDEINIIFLLLTFIDHYVFADIT